MRANHTSNGAIMRFRNRATVFAVLLMAGATAATAAPSLAADVNHDLGFVASARRSCDTTQITSWRNHVDIDVIGEIDTADNPMKQADVACRVFD